MKKFKFFKIVLFTLFIFKILLTSSFSENEASIIAKITRDFILKKVSQIYPYYNLENNKGYGTKQHVELIKKFGPSPFHRTTFKIR